MMTPTVKQLYNSASKNQEFLLSIREADNDEKPGLFSNDQEKAIFAAVYYGWLVGKYGSSNWKNYL